MCVSDSLLVAHVPTTVSSFPTVCMDLGGWPVGQAPSITRSQPITLTDSSVEGTPWLLIVLSAMHMLMWKAESR